MLGVLLVRSPDSRSVEAAGALSLSVTRVAQVLSGMQHGEAAADQTLQQALARMDQQLLALQHELDDAAIATAQLAEFKRSWRADRAHLAEPVDVEQALQLIARHEQHAHDLAAGVREHLDHRRELIDLGLKGLMAALAVLLLLPLHGLWQQRRQMHSSLHQFGDDLGADNWRDAVSRLRDERLGPPSAFDALASGVESVLGESDRRWQVLADLAADWYWETDDQHRLSWLSGSAPLLRTGAAQQLLGLRHDQIAAYNPPEGGWQSLHRRMQRHESFRDIEFAWRAPDGAVWMAISGRPRLGEDGRLLGYEGVGRDVSERKAAHQELLASEQRWSMMARLAADWYWQTDAQHRLLPMPLEQHRRFGEALAERLEGQTRWQAHAAALSEEQWAEHRADLDARRPFKSLQLEIEASEGRWLWISISGLPRFDAGGRFIGYHGVGRDITARKQAERLLLRHNDELQRAVDERTRNLRQVNLDLDAFSRQLAHELRTPIGQLQGLAQMLHERAGAQLGTAEQQLLQMQVQAASGMRATLDALLAMARSTLLPMPQQDVDLSALAAAVCAELPAVERRGELRWHIQPGMLARGNPEALKIVLTNLLGNAAKFTRDAASPSVRLSLRAAAAQRVCLRIEDNGIGFDAARATMLFRPFSRLHARDDYAGSGIGLSIVQRIVERHGGTVSARGEPQRGACFEITLAAAAQPAVQPETEALEADAQASC